MRFLNEGFIDSFHAMKWTLMVTLVPEASLTTIFCCWEKGVFCARALKASPARHTHLLTSVCGWQQRSCI